MTDFFKLEILITAISSGIITWLITRSTFKRNLKKEENDRLRNHLNQYLDSFLNLRKIINKYKTQYTKLLEIEKIKSDEEFEGKLKKIESTFENLHEDFENHQFKIDSIGSRLTMYELKGYSKDISLLLEPIQNGFDTFEIIPLNNKKESFNYESILEHFTHMDQLLKIQFYKIEKFTKKVYPK